ncbi:hypothetical protein M9Y10_009543 [Tritrichomonas musculus]|uniref:Leucine Rich Repeat family protein n=1 Tax=Tritrichomonas musculus TaxID=1915356 RepID=A0ABR2INM9_9EUKA
MDEELERLKYITIDPNKLRSLQQFCWCPFETAIVATPCEFNKKGKKGLRNGILMFTRGSIYLFKTKKLSKEIKEPILRHLLDARVFTVTPKDILIEYDDYTLQIKAEQTVKIAVPMIYVLRSSTFGLTSLQTMKIIGQGVTLPDVTIPNRPVDALKWRALFLAHFYNIRGMQLYTMDYFEKYEAKKTNLILIGPSLHPGNFAAAFGHAIAWESLIKIVYFQAFAPTKFTMFFDSLVENAVNIKRIVFTDYHNKQRLPEFSGLKISHSSVSHYNFYRILLPVVLNFFEKEKNLPQIQKLSIHKIEEIDADGFNRFADLAETNRTLQDTLRYFEFGRTRIENFPVQRFTTMINSFDKLECFTASFLNIDLTYMMKAICDSHIPIRVVHINYMTSNGNFASSTEKIVLPKSLIHLDLSFCNFSSDSLASFFKLLSTSQFDNPIILQLIKLTFDPEFYSKLRNTVDLSSCISNICEFDFSGNNIQTEASVSLFAYLFAQQNLRLVCFNKMECDDPVGFLKNVLTLISNKRLPGIEVSGNFDPVTMTQFISAIPSNDVSFLRHVGFKNAKAGSQGLGALNSLLLAANGIVELLADGFAPEQPALEAFWKTVASHPSIAATDFPQDDLKNLGFASANASINVSSTLPPSLKTILKPIHDDKARVATVAKKDEIALSNLRKGKPVDTTANLFLESSKTRFQFDVDNDFATIELETSKLKISQERDENQNNQNNNTNDDK